MHDLFTRGVTSDGRLRPPRNEAPQLYKESPLGWIPKEWTTARLNEVGDVRLGRQRAPKYDRGVNPRPYLRVVNVADDRLDLRDVGKMDFSPSEMEQYKLRSGDIVLTEGDLVSAYNVGRSAVFNGEIDECCFQNTLIRFRPRNPEQANYLHFGFCHVRARGHLARITTATTVHHLSSGRLKEIWLPLPMNIDERLGIADRLCAVESFRDKLQAEHRKIVDLRQGVMRDLLTGRVRVKVGEAVAA